MPKFRIGTDDFKELINEGGYFVDKSLFIREIIEGSKVTLLPRPRRFGKTLNMTMLRYFFEKTGTSNAYLFEKFQITSHPDCMKHQGQYPVIYLTLKQLKGRTYEEVETRIRKMVSELYRIHAYVSTILDTTVMQRDFDDLRNGTSSVGALKSSLRDLIALLYEYHEQPVIVLIDEYDAPMIEGWTSGYCDDISQFMRIWLGGGLKHDNAEALYRAVMTGILRIAKESIFSELNNLDVSTTLTSSPLSSMFGFTDKEVEKILHDFQRMNCLSTIREWYNGYIFGTETIYNPWSVSQYIHKYPAVPAPYWLNTSSNQLIYDELEAGGTEIKKDLEHLLSGKELLYSLPETITFKDIGRSSANIWSFLYFSGYLSAHDPEPDIRGRSAYQLSIPNKEISIAYETFIERTYPTQSGGLDELMDWFINTKPVSDLIRLLDDLVLSLLSMYDLARLPEAVFHAFVLGLLANLRSVYEIRSNAESGYGRADILMIPKTSRYTTAYIIEFKSIGQAEDIQKACTHALNQIHDNAYSAAVHNSGILPDQVRSLAIILQGKKVMIREGMTSP